jgi:hypothetical protein
VSTLAEIEAAADALPLEQKRKLLQFLESRVNGESEPKRPINLQSSLEACDYLKIRWLGKGACVASGNTASWAAAG